MRVGSEGADVETGVVVGDDEHGVEPAGCGSEASGVARRFAGGRNGVLSARDEPGRRHQNV